MKQQRLLPLLLLFWTLSVLVEALTEHEILVNVYASDLERTDNRTTEHCSWLGVTCDEQGHVTVLDLSRGRLRQSRLPPEVFQLPYLESLDLSYNALHELDVLVVASSTSLQTLRLAHCGLVSVSGLHRLASLSTLDLSDNPQLQPSLGSLSSLRTLVLDRVSTVFELPSSLRSLSWQEVSDLPTTLLLQLSSLQILDLQRHRLRNTTLPPELWSQLPLLRVLRLQGSHDMYRLKGTLQGPLPPLLTELDLSRNALTGVLPDDWNANATVQLQDNQFEGTVPESLWRTAHFLSIQGNRFTDWSCRVQCDTIACPVGTSNGYGYATPDVPCVDDPSAQFLGTMAHPDERTVLWELFEALQLSTNDATPCDWPGVQCHEGHVVALDLPGVQGTVPSSLQFLAELRSVTLRGPVVWEAWPSQVERLTLSDLQSSLQGIGACTQLVQLDLTNSDVGALPDELFQLTQLQVLELSTTQLSGKLSTQVGSLTQLRRLSLNDNQLSGLVPEQLGLLTDLEVLDLSDNGFQGELPASMSALSNMQSFRATASGVEGSLPSLAGWSRLTELALASNRLTGPIPDDFLSETSTEGDVIVNLADNQLTGVIPVSLKRFPFLTLDLENNQISGIPIMLCELSDWMNGEVADGRCDAILCPPGTWSSIGKTTSTVACDPCDSNVYYGMTTCEASGILNESVEETILDDLFASTGGRSWVKDQTNWTKKGVPICFREGVVCGAPSNDLNSGVSELRLNRFGLRGSIPTSVYRLPYLRRLAVSFNEVDLSFDGIEEATALEVIQASQTQVRSLKGIDRAPPSLNVVHFAKNFLAGPFPEQLLQLPSLQSVFLNENLLTGHIPVEIGTLSNLRDLSLSQNQFTGPIPSSLGLLSHVETIRLGRNSLFGPVPSQLSGLGALSLLDLSDQGGEIQLSGTVPAFSSNGKLITVLLNGNSFTGKLPTDLLLLVEKSASVTVDLSSNSLTGSIPDTYAAFDFLDVRLESNYISGIPQQLCSKENWMNGNVGEIQSCDAILCAPGSHAENGKASPGASCDPCVSLSDAPFYGATSCGGYDTVLQRQGR